MTRQLVCSRHAHSTRPQVYLERQGDDGSPGGSAPDSSNWEEVARLLSRKHGRIDSLHALNLLPGQVAPVLPSLNLLISIT